MLSWQRINIFSKGNYELEGLGEKKVKGNGNVAPIQLAVLLGATKILGLFIEHGGLGSLATNKDDEEEENMYEGIYSHFFLNIDIFRSEHRRQENGLGC
jgi:hypothetical protein